MRDVEVDDVLERLDVDAARGDVGRHQHLEVPLLKPARASRALGLAAVAVDAVARDPVLAEELGQPVRAVLGAREDQHVADVAAPQQLDEQRRLQLLRTG